MTSLPKESLRLFYAVALPEEVRASVAAHIARLREVAPEAPARWERTEKLHLTLKFLGAVARGRVPSLVRVVAEEAAATTPPFTLSIEGAGHFPPRGAPQVLWLGVTETAGHLVSLQAQIEEACARAGFPREQRPFRPHLTIARLHKLSPPVARRLAESHTASPFGPASFVVREMLLLQSELRPAGSLYTTLARLPLEG